MTASTEASAPNETLPRPAAVLSLGLGAFAIGIAELVAIGVVDRLSADLGVSKAAAGWLVAAYAAGVCLGGPMLAIRTAGRDPRRVLRATVALFVLCGVLTVASPTLALLLVVRFFAGALHGLYVGTATAHAASLVVPERRGQAVAMVFGGIAVATVVGAPLGAVLGQLFGWRATFVVVTMASLAALAAILRWVPSGAASTESSSAAAIRTIARPRVLAVLGLIVPLMGGVFALYTFITAYLEDVTKVSAGMVGGILLAFGAASAIGTFGGGRLADRSPWLTIGLTPVIVTATLGLLSMAGPRPLVTTGLLVICGLAAFAFIPAYQLWLMSLVPDATELAATLGASAANAGIVLGSLVGGAALSNTGPEGLSPVGAALCALASAAVLLTTRLVHTGRSPVEHRASAA